MSGFETARVGRGFTFGVDKAMATGNKDHLRHTFHTAGNTPKMADVTAASSSHYARGGGPHSGNQNGNNSKVAFDLASL